MNKFNKRLRPNGEMSIFHARADINELVKFCNGLADKVDELVTENNRLSQKIAEMEGAENEQRKAD